jgi:hypothetical protein
MMTSRIPDRMQPVNPATLSTSEPFFGGKALDKKKKIPLKTYSRRRKD